MKIDRGTIKAAVALLVMSALFAGVVLGPTSLSNARLQKRIDQARDDLGIGEVDKASLQRLRDRVSERRKLVEDSGRRVPDEQGLARVLRDLSGLINAPGVQNQQIVTERTNLYADYNSMPVKIQFSAPFATAFDLIQRIESLKYVIRIDKLSIEAEPDYPHQPLLVCLEMSAFFAAVQKEGPR